MTDAKSQSCPECGAALDPGVSCDDLLVKVGLWEQDAPGVKDTQHHLLVLCWEIQHPRRFSDQALAWACESVRRAVTEGLSTEELRDRSLEGQTPTDRVWKVMGGGGVAVQRKWPVTLADVADEGYAGLPESIQRWAESVLGELES